MLRAPRSPLLPLIAALLSGSLLALCFAPWNIANLVWFWMAPLVAVLWFWEPGEASRKLWVFRQPRWVWAGLTGWVSGCAFFLINLFWLRHVAWAGMILLSLYLAVYFGLWAAFAATAGRLRLAQITPADPEPVAPSLPSQLPPLLPGGLRPSGILMPSLHALRAAVLCSAAWVACEWLRGIVFTGFGWNGLAVALHDSPNLRQAADLVGVTGLSFLPAFVGTVAVATGVRFGLEFAHGGRLRPHLDFAAAMILLMATLLYGLHVHRTQRKVNPVEISGVLVQGNISIEQRYNLDPKRPASEIWELYEKFTSLYAGQGYDLILWPETCLPATFFEAPTQRYFNSILALGDFHLITGIDDVRLREDGGLDVYNSMLAMRGSTQDYQAYHKTHLVPFGEFIPFRNSFPIFNWALGRLIPEDFDAGKELNLLRLQDPDLEIIPTICFEDTIGRLTRRFLAASPQAPQVIINLTNDSWFNRSAANFQHLANARFRSVELKRPMIRCANTGVSGVIDEFGSLNDPKSPGTGKRLFVDRKSGSPFVAGCYPFRLQIGTQPPTTLYARWGDWFAGLMAAVAALAAALPSVFRKLRTFRATRTPSPGSIPKWKSAR